MAARRELPGPELAPFRDGNLMEYAGRARPGEVGEKWGYPDEWRPNEPVRMTLTLNTYERGRSAARFVWRDTEGRKFPMFMVDVLALMKTKQGVQGGTVTDRWIVVKRGTNYGIAALSAWAEGTYE